MQLLKFEFVFKRDDKFEDGLIAAFSVSIIRKGYGRYNPVYNLLSNVVTKFKRVVFRWYI